MTSRLPRVRAADRSAEECDARAYSADGAFDTTPPSLAGPRGAGQALAGPPLQDSLPDWGPTDTN